VNRALYFAALWAFTAIVVSSLHALQHAIGGRMPDLMISNVFIFGAWMLFTPLIVRLARRFKHRWALVHIPVAAAFAFGVLVLHKFSLCPPDDYIRCATNYDLLPWLYSWILSGAFFYAGTTIGIWLLDAADAAKESAIAAARLEQELADSELRLAQMQLRPESIAVAFSEIAQRLEIDAKSAEEMITTLADSLRERTRAFEAVP
jgi:H+/gluconate symporter-like permease